MIRGCLREHVELTFWLHFPLAPRLKELDRTPCRAYQTCPSGAEPRGLSQFSAPGGEYLRGLVLVPELGNVCCLWVGDLVTRVCPKPPQPPQLLKSFSTSSPIATSTYWLLAEVFQTSPAQHAWLLVCRERFRTRSSLLQPHILRLPLHPCGRAAVSCSHLGFSPSPQVLPLLEFTELRGKK